jgi:SRSO17 transposase
MRTLTYMVFTSNYLGSSNSTRNCRKCAQYWTEPLVQADQLVGGGDAVQVIDDTAIPKKGTLSVGVAVQYASHWARP